MFINTFFDICLRVTHIKKLFKFSASICVKWYFRSLLLFAFVCNRSNVVRNSYKSINEQLFESSYTLKLNEQTGTSSFIAMKY